MAEVTEELKQKVIKYLELPHAKKRSCARP